MSKGIRPFLFLFLSIAITIAAAAAAITAEGADSNEKKEGNTKNVISVTSAKELITVLSSNSSISLILISSPEIYLESLVEINKSGLTIRGNPDLEKIPTLRCSNDDAGISIQNNDIKIEDLEVADCPATAIAINNYYFESKDEQSDQSGSDNNENFYVGKSDQIVFSQVTLLNVLFQNNSNPGYGAGGALSIADGINVTVSNCIFKRNSAGDGGAIYLDGYSHMHVIKSEFIENEAEFAGGAIYASPGASENYHEFTVSQCSFTGNKALSGRQDTTGGSLLNGAPLENAKFLEFAFPSASGGAIYSSDFSLVEITNTTFFLNSAIPAGGALFFTDNLKVRLQANTFESNFVSSPLSGISVAETDLEHGGAIYAEFKETAHHLGVTNQFEVIFCTFINNTAAYGGAVHLVTDLTTLVSFEYADFIQNSASMAGGALLARNTINFEIRSANFSENRAAFGGAVLFTNGASAFFVKAVYMGLPRTVSYFTGNRALDGAGIFCLGAGTVNIQRSIFKNNHAERNGGGVCVIDSLPSGRLGLQEITFRSNSASKGGAVFLDSVAQLDLKITNFQYRNIFFNNTAQAGGALYIRSASNINNNALLNYGEFYQNKAIVNTEEIINDMQLDIPNFVILGLTQNSRKLLHNEVFIKNGQRQSLLLDTRGSNPCYPGGGGAICLILTEVPERAPAQITLQNSIFKTNEAAVGGALLIAIGESFEWLPDCNSVSTASSSLTIRPCRGFILQNNSFSENSALHAGAAIFASNPEKIHYRNSELDTATAFLSEINTSVSDFFKGNMLTGNQSYGIDLASNAKYLKMVHPSVVQPNGLVFADHTGGTELTKIELNLIDSFGSVVSSGIKDSELAVDIESSIISGQLMSSARHGVVSFENIIATAVPDIYNITLVPGYANIQELTFPISIRDCRIGERNFSSAHICSQCDPGFFGFDPSLPCEACPPEGFCSGGSVLVPKDGFWHSSPFSPQMHQCIGEEACQYKGRIDTLETFYKEIQNFSSVENIHLLSQDYMQCSKGYAGVLCGSCADGYAHSAGEDCIKCYNTKIAATVTLLLLLWTLIIFVITIRSTLASLRDIEDIILVGSASLELNNKKINMNADRARSDASCIPVTNYGEMFSQSGSFSVSLSSQSQSQLEVEELLADEKMSEVIKIIVNFFQITSIGVEIDTNWTAAVVGLLVTEGTIANAVSTTKFAPIECLLGGDSATRTIRGLLVQIATPFFLMLFVICAFLFLWIRCKKDSNSELGTSYLKSRVVICLLVGVFFAYDTVTELFLRILNCVSVDRQEPDLPSLYNQYGIAKDWYWASDTGITCFNGIHSILVYTISLPGIVLFTIGIPICLSIFFIKRRNAGLLNNKEFINTYGFVYQSYRKEFVFWESAIMLRKVCISAVIVYGYSLGSDLQSTIVMGILIIALVGHHIIGPFKYKSLNNLESLSLLASIFVFYSGIIFESEKTSRTAKIILGAIIVITNIGLLILFVYRLLKSTNNLLYAKLRVAGIKHNDIPDSLYKRGLMISKINASMFKKKVDTTVGTLIKSKCIRTKEETAGQSIIGEGSAEIPNPNSAINDTTFV